MTTQHIDLDVLVIGWGKAGKTLAGKLSATKRVGLVEQSSTMYGGTCINIGCVPTKNLLFKAAKRGDSDPDAYFEKTIAQRDAFISKMRSVNHRMLEGKVVLIDGHAEFIGDHEVLVTPSVADEKSDDTLTISAPTIIINTGATSRVPNIPGVDLPHVYNSTTIQHAEPFPHTLTIVGGGFIGLEFATMMNDFGSDVTVLDASDTFLARLDRDVAESVKTTMEAQGVKFVSSVKVEEIASTGDSSDSSLTVRTDKGDFTSDAVLLATGRVPATADLGLDKAGIETDARGYVVVDDHLRTNVEGIYAVGDVNGGPQFTYISYDDHRIVLDDLLGKSERVRTDRVAVPTATFIRPALSTVGLTEDHAREAGYNVRIAKKNIAEIPVMPRPKIVGSPEGLAKFVIDADTDQILGATLYCIDSQELINMVALTMRLKAPSSVLRDGIWTHPASTELFNGVL